MTGSLAISRAAPPAEPVWLFYDGTCGVCHGGVRFALRHDRAGLLRFAPLGGDTHTRLVPPGDPSRSVDSLVVRTADGTLRVRTAALVELLAASGRAWRLLGRAVGAVPRPVRDAAYDLFARHRRRFAAPPSDLCPVLPPEQRARFSP